MTLTKVRVAGQRRTRFCRSHWSFGVYALLLATFFQFTSRIVLAGDALDRPITLDIPANTPLDEALIEWGVKAGVELMINTQTIAHQTTHGLHGTMSAANALSVLLRDSGLTYTAQGERIRVVPVATLVRSAQWEEQPEAQSANLSSDTQAKPPGESNAQKEGELAVTNPNTDAGFKELEQVVVTAQKREERLQDVPISLSVVNGDELDRSTSSSVGDLLNTVPGVSVSGFDLFGAGTVVTIRGVSTGAEFAGASTAAYYIDGVSFGFVRFAIVPDSNLYDLQDIEALRGPQGTLYGANALNGAVLVNTHDPDLNNFDFKARTLTSTTDTGGWNYGGDMAANIPIVGGELAMRVAVSEAHLSGWIDSPLGEHINSGDTNNLRVKIKAQPTDNLSFVLTAWHSQTDVNGPPTGSEGGFFDQSQPAPNNQRFNVLGLKANYDFSSFTVSSVTSYMDYRNTGIFDLAGLVPPPPGLNAPLDLTSRVYSEEINLLSKSAGAWHWSAGALYRNDKDVTKEWQNIYIPSEAPAPSTTLLLSDFTDTSKSTAVYGEIGRRFARDFEWSLGLRYFHDDAKDYENSAYTGETGPLTSAAATFHAVTPRAILQWFPNEELTAYATYSQGFRSGLIQSDTVQRILPEFPAASPDKLTNYELGIKGTGLDRRVSYDVDVFYNYWAHVQQQIGVPYNLPSGGAGGIVSVTLNGQAASGVGAEFSLSARPVIGLELAATFSWNNLHFDSNVYSAGALIFAAGDRLGNSPKYTGNLSAQYTFALGGSGLKGQLADSANYISRLTTTYIGTTPNTDPSQAMLTDKGSFSIVFPKHWTATLFIDNAFNNRETPSPGPTPNYDLRIRPRTVGLSADYKFD